MPKTPLSFYLHMIAVAVIVVALGHFFYSSNAGARPTTTAAKESVYDRVMRTGVIRCGYGIYPPFIIKDANSAQIQGIFPEYLYELGKLLNIKFEFPQEVGFGDFIEALQQDKIDAYCGVWENATRGVRVDFTTPIFFNTIIAVVRADDSRFDQDLWLANQENIVIAATDGESSSIVARESFPLAKTMSLPQLSDVTMILRNVADKKADIVFVDVINAKEFIANNPGTLKIIHADKPLRNFATTLGIKSNEYQFLRMLNIGTNQLLTSGVLEQILQKYEKYPGSLYRVAKPYQTPTAN